MTLFDKIAKGLLKGQSELDEYETDHVGISAQLKNYTSHNQNRYKFCIAPNKKA